MGPAPPGLGVLVRPAVSPEPFGRQSLFFSELAAAARACGTEVFCFAPPSRVVGPVPGWSLRGQCWQPVDRALPAVVYDRFLPRSWAERQAHGECLRALAAQGVAWFNPPELQALLDDKWAFSLWLGEQGVPMVSHLTLDQARPQLLVAATGGYFVKPRFGFGGAGIGYLELTSEGASLIWLRAGRPASAFKDRQTLLAELEASNEQQELLLSPASKGPGIQGRVFDIRILLQRPRPGADYRYIGFLRLGPRGQMLSNLSRGGRALPIETLAQLPGLQQVPAALDRLCGRLVAELGERFGPWAELGLDWLIDREGRPRLLEANAKPARWALTRIAEDPNHPPGLRQIYADRRRQSVEMPLRFGLTLGEGRSGSAR